MLALAGPACAQTAAIEMRIGVAYGPFPVEQGDLFIPAEPKGRKPAIVMIHGGGWIGGSRSGDTDLARSIASKGVVVFNVDYRLAVPSQPETRWPAQLLDAQLAVRFLRAHAEALGVDPARIGAMGDSAGAQLAVFLGVLPRSVPGDVAGLYSDQRPDVAAVVDQFGPMDLPAMGASAAGSISALFGPVPPSGAALLTASPLPSIGSRSAPIYIIHGERDEIVPFEQSRQLADTVRVREGASELVAYKGGHEYQGVAPEEVARLQAAAVTWLVGRLRR